MQPPGVQLERILGFGALLFLSSIFGFGILQFLGGFFAPLCFLFLPRFWARLWTNCIPTRAQSGGESWVRSEANAFLASA